jgi:Fe-S-cluster containining protein
MGPIDFFRNMHDGFGGILAARLAPGVLVDRLATSAFELFERNVAIETEGLPALDCQKNCPSCCTLRVTATAPEIFLLAHYVRLIDASPQGARLNLPKRVAQANRATEDLDGSRRMALRRPCPLILKGVCIVHPVRPLACRGHASFDRAACARAAAGRDVEIPVSEAHLQLRGLVQNALQSALRRSGLPWGLYELNHALVLALDRKDRRARWAAGTDSLAPGIADINLEAAAATFDQILTSE